VVHRQTDGGIVAGATNVGQVEHGLAGGIELGEEGVGAGDTATVMGGLEGTRGFKPL